jgi:hypothetical protein
MKKTLLLIIPLFFLFVGCEEEQDTTPPTVSISSPVSGQTVNQIVTILVTTQDNEGIDRVEFYIDDSLFFTDTELPYEYQWNTTQYGDGSGHIVKVISYDNSGNLTESQPIMLIVDSRVYLWGEYYHPSITTTLNLSDKNLGGSIPPEIGNLINLTDLSLRGNQLTGSIPSEIGNLTKLIYLVLRNNLLTGSIPQEIGNLTDLSSLSLNINQLTGTIPTEIGNLSNLTWLELNNNQLTGEIPESICDLNIDWNNNFYISNNQLCPPYPSCIENYVGVQDTTNCN